LLCQTLEEEGIGCQIVGEHVETLYGLAHAWNRPGIVVSEENEQRAREVLASRLGAAPEDPPLNLKFQYGLRALLVNFMLIAVIFAFYRPFGPAWPDFAFGAFLLLVIGNVFALIYVRKRRKLREYGEKAEAE
jgi:hypothetical protein